MVKNKALIFIAPVLLMLFCSGYTNAAATQKAAALTGALTAEDAVFYSEGSAVILLRDTLKDVERALPQGELYAPDGLEGEKDWLDVVSWDTDTAQLQFNYMDGEWILSYIWSNESIESARGVSVGSTKKDVVKAYGKGKLTEWTEGEGGDSSTLTYYYELEDMPPAYMDFWLNAAGKVEAITAGLVDDTVGA